MVGLALSGSLLTAAIMLARLNIRRGRGDRRGASRLAGFTACVFMLIWVFGGSHVADFWRTDALLRGALSYALLLAAAAVGPVYGYRAHRAAALAAQHDRLEPAPGGGCPRPAGGP
jgi:hypothetical protein